VRLDRDHCRSVGCGWQPMSPSSTSRTAEVLPGLKPGVISRASGRSWWTSAAQRSATSYSAHRTRHRRGNSRSKAGQLRRTGSRPARTSTPWALTVEMLTGAPPTRHSITEIVGASKAPIPSTAHLLPRQSAAVDQPFAALAKGVGPVRHRGRVCRVFAAATIPDSRPAGRPPLPGATASLSHCRFRLRHNTPDEMDGSRDLGKRVQSVQKRFTVSSGTRLDCRGGTLPPTPTPRRRRRTQGPTGKRHGRPSLTVAELVTAETGSPPGRPVAGSRPSPGSCGPCARGSAATRRAVQILSSSSGHVSPYSAMRSRRWSSPSSCSSPCCSGSCRFRPERAGPLREMAPGGTSFAMGRGRPARGWCGRCRHAAAGDRVPADVRVTLASNLAVDEAAHRPSGRVLRKIISRSRDPGGATSDRKHGVPGRSSRAGEDGPWSPPGAGTGSGASAAGAGTSGSTHAVRGTYRRARRSAKPHSSSSR
jgi:hypothetical protein